jgi:hypothetical protein
MLHGMSDVTCLDQMLNDNCGFPIHLYLLVWILGSILTKSFLPTGFTQLFQHRIHDVRCHDCIDDKLSETFNVATIGAKRIAKLRIRRFHEHIPCEIDGILFRDTPSFVHDSQLVFFLHELVVGHPGMVHLKHQHLTTKTIEIARVEAIWAGIQTYVVNQRSKNASELRQRIGCNPVRMIMELGQEILITFLGITKKGIRRRNNSREQLGYAHGYMRGLVIESDKGEFILPEQSGTKIRKARTCSKLWKALSRYIDAIDLT